MSVSSTTSKGDGHGGRDATRGRFVVLEGAEGTGKSTQLSRLADWLRSIGHDVVSTREPGGTDVGELIRGVVLDRADIRIEAETELLLILAARAAFVRQVVAPALEAGSWVVSDRFDLSTMAYQGYGRGIPLDVIQPLNDFATGGITPDLYVVLDVPIEVGRARQVAQGKTSDRIESGGDEFFGRVREGYVALCERLGAAVLVDASGTVDEVEARVRAQLRSRFSETLGDGSV